MEQSAPELSVNWRWITGLFKHLRLKKKQKNLKVNGHALSHCLFSFTHLCQVLIPISHMVKQNQLKLPKQSSFTADTVQKEVTKWSLPRSCSYQNKNDHSEVRNWAQKGQRGKKRVGERLFSLSLLKSERNMACRFSCHGRLINTFPVYNKSLTVGQPVWPQHWVFVFKDMCSVFRVMWTSVWHYMLNLWPVAPHVADIIFYSTCISVGERLTAVTQVELPCVYVCVPNLLLMMSSKN